MTYYALRHRDGDRWFDPRAGAWSWHLGPHTVFRRMPRWRRATGWCA